MKNLKEQIKEPVRERAYCLIRNQINLTSKYQLQSQLYPQQIYQQIQAQIRDLVWAQIWNQLK